MLLCSNDLQNERGRKDLWRSSAFEYGRSPGLPSEGSESDDFVVTNPLNKFVNKQQVLGMVESGFLVITSYDRQIEYVRSYGEMVIVAGSETVVWGGKMPNAGKTEHLRFTGIWMKQNGRWQEVARHANIVPQQS